jgi:hypothetical protein
VIQRSIRICGRLAIGAAALALTAACTTSIGGKPAADPAVTPEPDCPGMLVEVQAHDDLDAVVVSQIPRDVPADDKLSGPQSIDDVLLGYDEGDKATARQTLTDAGYVDGFDRIWQRGDLATRDWHLEGVSVYRFGTPRGACKFARWQADRANETAFPAAVPGAKGTINDDGGTLHAGSALATKGRYVLSVSALANTEQVRSWIAPLLETQYNRL